MHRALIQCVNSSTDRLVILASLGFLQLPLQCFDSALIVASELLPSGIAATFLERKQNVVRFHACFYDLTFAEVLLSVVKGGNDHVFDLAVRETIRRLHLNLCFLAA